MWCVPCFGDPTSHTEVMLYPWQTDGLLCKVASESADGQGGFLTPRGLSKACAVVLGALKGYLKFRVCLGVLQDLAGDLEYFEREGGSRLRLVVRFGGARFGIQSAVEGVRRELRDRIDSAIVTLATTVAVPRRTER